LLHVAPSVERVRASHQSSLHGEQIKVRADASVGARKNCKKSAADGRPRIWKNARRVVLPLPNELLAFALTSFLRNGNAAWSAESAAFDLAVDFLCSIVVPDDVMTV
jgi:hypothetical protein